MTGLAAPDPGQVRGLGIVLDPRGSELPAGGPVSTRASVVEQAGVGHDAVRGDAPVAIAPPAGDGEVKGCRFGRRRSATPVTLEDRDVQARICSTCVTPPQKALPRGAIIWRSPSASRQSESELDAGGRREPPTVGRRSRAPQLEGHPLGVPDRATQTADRGQPAQPQERDPMEIGAHRHLTSFPYDRRTLRATGSGPAHGDGDMTRILLLFVLALWAPATAGPPAPTQTPRRIALTFDDAPRRAQHAMTTEERRVALLEALASRGVTAAFFVTTRGFEEQEDGRARVRSYAEAGHLIANHTHTHPWAHKVKAKRYLQEVDRAEKLLEGLPNRRPWFRFPYLDEGRRQPQVDAIAAGLAERGLVNGYVTVDNYDWYLDKRYQEAVEAGLVVDERALAALYIDLLVDAARFFDDAAVGALGRSPVHVLLLHENDLAALYVDELIDALRARGWEVVSPDVAYADPIAARIPKTLFTMQGRVAALADESGRAPRTFDLWASDETRIDAQIRWRKVFVAPAAPAP